MWKIFRFDKMNFLQPIIAYIFFVSHLVLALDRQNLPNSFRVKVGTHRVDRRPVESATRAATRTRRPLRFANLQRKKSASTTDPSFIAPTTESFSDNLHQNEFFDPEFFDEVTEDDEQDDENEGNPVYEVELPIYGNLNGKVEIITRRKVHLEFELIFPDFGFCAIPDMSLDGSQIHCGLGKCECKGTKLFCESKCPSPPEKRANQLCYASTSINPNSKDCCPTIVCEPNLEENPASINFIETDNGVFGCINGKSYPRSACIQELTINKQAIDPRHIMETSHSAHCNSDNSTRCPNVIFSDRSRGWGPSNCMNVFSSFRPSAKTTCFTRTENGEELKYCKMSC